MSYLLAFNQLKKENLQTITHVSNGGKITQTTSPYNIVSRSVTSAYEYSYAGIGTETITLEFFNPIKFEAVVLAAVHIGTNVQAIRVYNGSSLVATDDHLIDEQSRIVGGVYVSDFVIKMQDFSSCNKVEIDISDVNLISGQIGCVALFGKVFEFGIKPNASYLFESKGAKVRSDGGQVWASHIGSYKKMKFKTTPLSTSYFFSGGGLAELNYQSGVAEPLCFVPKQNGRSILFGTQSKPFSLNYIQAKVDEDWLLEASFEIEEEF